MADFDLAIPVILKHEGGWVNDPADLGKETNFGISTLMVERIQKKENLSNAQVAQMLGVAENTLYKDGYMKPMKVEAAKQIYKKYFWDLPGYNRLQDQIIATKVMDIAVNCGEGNAAKILQRACNSLGSTLVVDGKAGPLTFAAANGHDPKKLLAALKDEQLRYYESIIVARPANEKFRKNWTKRAAWG